MSIPKTIDEARWALLDELGVGHEHLGALEQRLDRDYTVHAYGYGQFADLGDVRLRAVVSDQLLRARARCWRQPPRRWASSRAARRARRRRANHAQGPDAVAVLRDSSAIDMALSGFFAALPSALDCLAGVAIAVSRMPKSITKADINDLRPLGTKQQATGTPTQQQTWSDLAAFADAQQAALPSGWFDWLVAMRNLILMTHRARQERILLQQTIEKGEPQLAVVTDTPADVTDTWRFDLHLRKRPALPDMQDFTVPGAITDLWIAERATDTVAAVLLLATGLVETSPNACSTSGNRRARRQRLPRTGRVLGSRLGARAIVRRHHRCRERVPLRWRSRARSAPPAAGPRAAGPARDAPRRQTLTTKNPRWWATP
jgi:hypothetical protein